MNNDYYKFLKKLDGERKYTIDNSEKITKAVDNYLQPNIKETINTDKRSLQGIYCNVKFKKLPNNIEELWNIKANKITCYKNCEKIGEYIQENYSNKEAIVAITEGRPNMIRALTKILLENNYDVYDYLIILDKDGKIERHSIAKVKLD